MEIIMAVWLCLAIVIQRYMWSSIISINSRITLNHYRETNHMAIIISKFTQT